MRNSLIAALSSYGSYISNWDSTNLQDISWRQKTTYNLDRILPHWLYGRALFPSSKPNTFEHSKRLREQPGFEFQHVYRAFGVIASESDLIQAERYKNILAVSKRCGKVFYYDCTNYFFEIELEEGIKQYGPFRERRPNPIVGMSLFVDGDGISLAFGIHSENANEQTTLKSLEQQILKDFKSSKFIVCTDAG